ncbi:MAG TPA: hypothetical protein VGE47_08250 [Burkholderiaceae bacterium]
MTTEFVMWVSRLMIAGLVMAVLWMSHDRSQPRASLQRLAIAAQPSAMAASAPLNLR